MSVWVEDADKLEVDSAELDIVYVNRRVKEFLDNNDCLGIAGIKGQGKTFLMKVKRKRMESTSVYCIPRNMPVDTIDSDSISINDSLMKLLYDYNSWVRLWKIGLCVTIINSIRKNTTIEDLDFLDDLCPITKELFNISNKNECPTIILNALLSLDIRDVLEVFGDMAIMMRVVSNLNKSVVVFIDKIDQAFSRYSKNFNEDSVMPHRSRNASIWQYAQFGLAEASYDIFALGTHHVKVYFSIRHEALIDAERINKDKARNILSYISILSYSKKDLEEMYRLYIANEKDSDLIIKEYKEDSPSKAFLGIEYIDHGYVKGKNEAIFDYIYRHTFQRPYDVMRICRALFLEGKYIDVQSIRHVTNNESTSLLKFYLEELSIFLPIDVEDILRIAEMINSNIIDLDYMKEVCKISNKELSMTWQCNNSCVLCCNIQPFSILNNLGLIGVVKQNPADRYPLQSFMNIGNSILGLNRYNLKDSPFYFVHPALSNYAREKRSAKGMPYWNNNRIIVGDGACSDIEDDKYMQDFLARANDQLKREKVFVSSTINDLIHIRNIVRGGLYERGFHPVLSEKSDFDVSNAQDNHSHDHCIDEMLKCKSVVFLIGESYGGIYTGDKYTVERDEIIHKVQEAGKDLQPSISLMEYYVARRNGLACYAFISKELASKIDDANDSSINKNIKNEVKFINHIRVGDEEVIRGNWMSAYTDDSDLMERISRLRFVTRLNAE